MAKQKSKAISDITSNDSLTSDVARVDIKQEIINSEADNIPTVFMGSNNEGMLMDSHTNRKTESVEMNIKKDNVYLK